MSGQVDNNLRNAYLLHLNGTALTFPDVENIELVCVHCYAAFHDCGKGNEDYNNWNQMEQLY